METVKDDRRNLVQAVGMGDDDVKTRQEARRELIEDSMDCIDYEQFYKDEDRERKIAAGIVAGQVYSKVSAPDSKTYWKNPMWIFGGKQYYGDSFHIRLPVYEALPPWAWMALFWSTAFFVTFFVVLILLRA